MATRIKSNQITDNVITADDLHSAIAINTTAAGTFGSVVVGNYTLGNSRISTNQANSYNGDIMLDAAGKIILDTDVGNVQFKDNGQTYAEMERSNGNVILYGAEQDKTIEFKGNVSGTATTGLILDFANSGRATFNENVITTGTLAVNGATMGSGFEFQVNGDARITNYIEASSATFGNTTLTGFLRGPGTFTIDPAAHGDDTGTVVIAGNLQVDGTTTTINSTTVSIDDKNLTLASGSINAAASNGAGLTIDVGTNSPTIADATFSYTSSNDTWALNKTLTTSGNLQTASHSFWRASGATSGAGVASGFSPTTSATGASSLSTGSHYVYRLTTTGTGTNSGATYIVWYEDDNSTWKARAVSLAGNESNHPLLDVTSSGAITIYTNHTSVYGINYTVERVSTVEPDGLAHSLGEFYNWQRLTDDIFYTDGNVGIGTDSPNQLLEIQDSTPGLRIHANDINSSPNPKIELVRGTSSTFGGDAYTDWRLEVQNDAKFRITSHDSVYGENVRFIVKHQNGYVGIGTANPTGKLDVHHNDPTVNSATLMKRTSTEFGWEEEYWFNANVIATTAGTAYVTFQFSNASNTNLHNMHIDYTFGCHRVGGSFGGSEGDTVKGTGSYWNNGSGGDSARSGEAEVIGVGIIEDVYIETTGTFAFRLVIDYVAHSHNKKLSGKIKLLNNPATGTSPAVTVTI